ncbi:MAG: hypothetical protein LCH37_10580 [Bacteroidetes bacterium]|nr:hypothetical protein [Bacteroidota bacterium]
MKIYLTKTNRKTVDYVLLELEEHFVKHTEGKVGKSVSFNSTLNAGSRAKAEEEINSRAQQYLEKGFVNSKLPKELRASSSVFDKAKWHLNEEFPKDVDPIQSYVHTGFFICWLIENKLLTAEFIAENSSEISLIRSRACRPSQFYADYMNGIFDEEGLTEEALNFTSFYFDFESGNYLADYLAVLDPQDTLPTLFHIADSWENYDKLKPVLNQRFMEWKNTLNKGT